ncbi:MAG: outer membrane protein assembly factor BamA [Elusimicrobia bacterium]|nr:outer membrane protein assembly factor BamA [Elusimicrobiota bacterium]
MRILLGVLLSAAALSPAAATSLDLPSGELPAFSDQKALPDASDVEAAQTRTEAPTAATPAPAPQPAPPASQAPAVSAASPTASPAASAPVISDAPAPAPTVSTAPAAVAPAVSSPTVSTPAVSTAAAPAPIVSTAAASAPVISTAPASAAVAPPWVLGDIAVEGNKNVKAGVVRRQIKARKGDLYDRPDLDRDVQSLLGLGSFERVAADVAPLDKPVPEQFRKVAGSGRMVRLTFLLKEKPVIKKVKFAGNKKLSRGALEDATSQKAKDPLDELKLREDQDKILSKYQEKGYLDASASFAVARDTAAQQATVTWTVSEGPRSHIERVTVAGAKAFKPKVLVKQMKNRPKGWFRSGVFSEKDLPEDVKKIQTYYLNRGYLDVSVSTPAVAISSDKTKIDIALAVEEGRPYRHGDTSFDGNAVIACTELVKALEYRRGRIFNQQKFDDSIRAIQELYADKGRLRAHVTPVKTFNAATNLMDVRLDIVEGPIVYIDHVDVEGNKATKTYVLKREVTVKPAQIFSLSRIRKSRERIMNLGFMDDVEIDIQPTQDPDRVDVIFDVTEGKPGMLTAGAAYSSVDGLIGTLSLQHMNLFGRAQRASLQWSFGKRVQDYSASWTTPWVKNKPMSLGLDLFNTRRVSPFGSNLSGYVDRRTGGTIRLGPRFEEDKYHLNLTYTLSRVSVENIDQEFLGTLTPGTSIYSSLSAEFARDTRDNIWDPARGSRNSVGIALTGGPLRGDVHLFKPWLSNAIHFTLLRVEDYPLVLSFNNRASYVTQFNETKEVPVFERFFVGGQDSLRGYAAAGEVGFPTGGKVYDVANVELGFPLARERKRTIVKLVGFFDIGSAWDRLRDVRAHVGPGIQDLKCDAGIGIRFTTPAFPIRLDWGYGFNHRPGERLYQINFGLGNLF